MSQRMCKISLARKVTNRRRLLSGYPSIWLQLFLLSCSNNDVKGNSAKKELSSNDDEAEFEKAMPPSNVSASYLAAVCSPTKVDKQNSLGDTAPNLVITCDYSNNKNNQQADVPKFVAGEAEVTLVGGKKLTVPLVPSAGQTTSPKAKSEFQISGLDWLSIDTISHKSLKFADKKAEKTISITNPISAQVDMEGNLLGLQGNAYLLPSNIDRYNEFIDVSKSTPLGQVRLPPWQISWIHSEEKLANFSAEQSALKGNKKAQRYLEEVNILKKSFPRFELTKQGKLPAESALQKFSNGFKIKDSAKIKDFLVKLEGKIDLPVKGRYFFQAEVRSAIRITINGQVILSSEKYTYTPQLVEKNCQKNNDTQANNGTITTPTPTPIPHDPAAKPYAAVSKVRPNTEFEAGTYPIVVEYIYSENWNREEYDDDCRGGAPRIPPLLSFKWRLPNTDWKEPAIIVPYWNLHQ